MKKNFIAIKKEFITKAKCKSLIKTLDKNLITDGNEYRYYIKFIYFRKFWFSELKYEFVWDF